MRELDAVSWMSGGGRHRSCIEEPPEVECYDIHRMTSLLGSAEVGPLYCSCNLSELQYNQSCNWSGLGGPVRSFGKLIQLVTVAV